MYFLDSLLACIRNENEKKAWTLWRSLVWSVFLFLSFTPALYANNLKVENVELVERNTTNSTIQIEFDLSWENAWKDSTNNDAAWVFAKYSTDNGSTWYHATLSAAGTNPSGFSQGTKQSGSAITGLDFIVPSDKKGCFVQAKSTGAGTLDFHDVQLVWNYGANAVTDAEAVSSNTKVRVFAVEMVYIPEGGFYVGDGNEGTNGEFEFGGASTSQPGSISSEGGLSFGTGASQWYYNSDSSGNDDASGTAFEVSASFPKGYQAFYLMKYEITEGQWVGFFNTLTAAQQTTRDITSSSGKNSDAVVNRNTISWASGDAATTRTDRAIAYLSWMDVAAYGDWAALRPLTEFEYEKAARGPLSAVINERCWGTTSATQPANVSGVSEDGTEIVDTPAAANINHGNVNLTGGDGPNRGPLRAGIFSQSTTTTRGATGAGYYGNKELCGNVWERVVSVGNSAGRSYAGTHGDGTLTSTASYEGNATNLDWPGLDATDSSRGVTGASGVGLRGSGWSETTNTYYQTSNRYLGASADNTRGTSYGGRLARTAP